MGKAEGSTNEVESHRNSKKRLPVCLLTNELFQRLQTPIIHNAY